MMYTTSRSIPYPRWLQLSVTIEKTIIVQFVVMTCLDWSSLTSCKLYIHLMVMVSSIVATIGTFTILCWFFTLGKLIRYQESTQTILLVDPAIRRTVQGENFYIATELRKKVLYII